MARHHLAGRGRIRIVERVDVPALAGTSADRVDALVEQPPVRRRVESRRRAAGSSSPTMAIGSLGRRLGTRARGVRRLGVGAGDLGQVRWRQIAAGVG